MLLLLLDFYSIQMRKPFQQIVALRSLGPRLHFHIAGIKSSIQLVAVIGNAVIFKRFTAVAERYILGYSVVDRVVTGIHSAAVVIQKTDRFGGFNKFGFVAWCVFPGGFVLISAAAFGVHSIHTVLESAGFALFGRAVKTRP